MVVKNYWSLTRLIFDIEINVALANISSYKFYVYCEKYEYYPFGCNNLKPNLRNQFPFWPGFLKPSFLSFLSKRKEIGRKGITWRAMLKASCKVADLG